MQAGPPDCSYRRGQCGITLINEARRPEAPQNIRAATRLENVSVMRPLPSCSRAAPSR